MCLCVCELWIILLPGWMHESAFSVNMWSSSWLRCTDWERSAVTSWPHHRHTLCSEAKETGLLSILLPSREHLHLSWLSLDNLDRVVCACWRGQLPVFLKSLFPPPNPPTLIMTFGSSRAQFASGHRNWHTQRSHEVTWVCLGPCVHW